MTTSIRAVLALAAVALVAAVPMSASAATTSGQAKKLRTAITLQGLKAHEQALQKIATANGGTRASGTPGYEASVEYVVSQLEAAGYQPTVQEFEFLFFQELAPSVFERVSPDPRVFEDTTEYNTMQYSGSGDVEAAVQEVNDNQFPPGEEANSSSAGCEAEDFDGFTPGNVALIQRGTCAFGDKAFNAQEAGASAVIVFNEGQEGRTDPINGTLGRGDITIPAVDTSFAIGEEFHTLLQGTDPVIVHISTSTLVEPRMTSNVIADTPGGDPNRIVVQGSHLDSVLEGPGINDNGSGSSYNLESAIQLAEQHITPRNKIRFAWWGGEEENLLGSTFYVNNLSEEEAGKIMLNLNFDMLASPNFVRFVYDGDGSDTGTAGPDGSGQIEQVFTDWFDSQGLATSPTPFNGRSDYGPFIAIGIPAGGLFSGAEGVKTAEEVEVYGGVEGEAYDRCYHQACDTITNLNDTSFDQLADGAATALVTFARTKRPVTGTTLSRQAMHQRMAQQEFRGNHLQR